MTAIHEDDDSYVTVFDTNTDSEQISSYLDQSDLAWDTCLDWLNGSYVKCSTRESSMDTGVRVGHKTSNTSLMSAASFASCRSYWSVDNDFVTPLSESTQLMRRLSNRARKVLLDIRGYSVIHPDPNCDTFSPVNDTTSPQPSQAFEVTSEKPVPSSTLCQTWLVKQNIYTRTGMDSATSPPDTPPAFDDADDQVFYRDVISPIEHVLDSSGSNLEYNTADTSIESSICSSLSSVTWDEYHTAASSSILSCSSDFDECFEELPQVEWNLYWKSALICPWCTKNSYRIAQNDDSQHQQLSTEPVHNDVVSDDVGARGSCECDTQLDVSDIVSDMVFEQAAECTDAVRSNDGQDISLELVRKYIYQEVYLRVAHKLHLESMTCKGINEGANAGNFTSEDILTKQTHSENEDAENKVIGNEKNKTSPSQKTSKSPRKSETKNKQPPEAQAIKRSDLSLVSKADNSTGNEDVIDQTEVRKYILESVYRYIEEHSGQNVRYEQETNSNGNNDADVKEKQLKSLFDENNQTSVDYIPMEIHSTPIPSIDYSRDDGLENKPEYCSASIHSYCTICHGQKDHYTACDKNQVEEYVHNHHVDCQLCESPDKHGEVSSEDVSEARCRRCVSMLMASEVSHQGGVISQSKATDLHVCNSCMILPIKPPSAHYKADTLTCNNVTASHGDGVQESSEDTVGLPPSDYSEDGMGAYWNQRIDELTQALQGRLTPSASDHSVDSESNGEKPHCNWLSLDDEFKTVEEQTVGKARDTDLIPKGNIKTLYRQWKLFNKPANSSQDVEEEQGIKKVASGETTLRIYQDKPDKMTVI